MQLGVGYSLVGRTGDVHVRDDERLVPTRYAQRLADTALLGPREARNDPEPEPARLRASKGVGIQGHVAVLDDVQLRAEQNRVGLSGKRRAQESMVQIREHTADGGGGRKWPQARPLRDVTDRCHGAPSFELRESPDRQLLQADDVGTVLDGEAHALLEERRSLGRVRITVKDVPGPDKQALYCTADVRRPRGPAGVHAGLRP